MRFRFRVGPFTFGRSGTRLSLWKRGTGISIPLSEKKGGTFGKIRIGPVSGYLGGPSSKPRLENEQKNIDPNEVTAIEAFSSDQQFLQKLLDYGVPWRGIQERLKEELPAGLSNRDEIAYRLVPIAMNALFGEQNTAWKTEKRPSKSGNGFTTWIVIINTGA